MHLNHPLILTFAMVFEAVNLPLTLLLWIQHLSVANLDEFVHQSFVHQSGNFLNKFSSSFSKRHQKEILSSKTLFFVNGRMFLKMAIFIHSPYIYRTWYCEIIFFSYWILTLCFNVQYFLSIFGICTSAFSGLTRYSMLIEAPICGKISVTMTTYMRIVSQLYFLLHMELPEQLTLDNNDSTVNLNRAIFRAAWISCWKLLNVIKTISPLKENVHHLLMQCFVVSYIKLSLLANSNSKDFISNLCLEF